MSHIKTNLVALTIASTFVPFVFSAPVPQDLSNDQVCALSTTDPGSWLQSGAELLVDSELVAGNSGKRPTSKV